LRGRGEEEVENKIENKIENEIENEVEEEGGIAEGLYGRIENRLYLQSCFTGNGQ
jgi:hypothetical protein